MLFQSNPVDELPGVKLERLDNGLMDFDTVIEWLSFAFWSRPLPRMGKTMGDKARNLPDPTYGDFLLALVDRVVPSSDGLRWKAFCLRWDHGRRRRSPSPAFVICTKSEAVEGG